LGDIPDAERWLDYVLRCYLTSYPSWGSDEGGWAQGLSYWSFYVYNLTNFAEALRDVSETDLFRRPFYRNTGYLPLYFHPPYAPMGGFGDGSYHRPSEVEGLLTDFLAGVFRDPFLKWEANEVLRTAERNETKWREWFMEDVISTWRAASPPAVSAQPPASLDGSRHFPDIGWVSMHSALGDAANDVWVSFKASRFGSYSHSHADQNTFQLYAYGRALAIDSGYYPSYGTPHDNLWTRQTRAHNGILVNGRGQPPFTWEADGAIEEFRREGVITLVRGSAAGAYNLPQPKTLASAFSPSLEPKLDKFDRTLAFVASRKRPLLVISDSLAAAGPATFEWLLHALNEMETDERSGTILVKDADVRLAVRVVASVPLRFSQTGRFPIQPEFASNTAYVLGKAGFPDQWHLTATTGQPSAEMKFLAVLVPYRASEPAPEITPVQTQGHTGFRVGETEVTAWWGPGTAGPLGETGSRLEVHVREDGRLSTAIVR
ncbi:MAG: heparinase II/III family protein, partial [Acidobacteria bacterium]|nr:heparinase II/III family protein [Acidobacteriota bacterium]